MFCYNKLLQALFELEPDLLFAWHFLNTETKPATSTATNQEVYAWFPKW